MIRIATLVQRAIRAGILAKTNSCLSHVLVRFSEALLLNQSLFAFLRGYRFQQRTAMKIITFDWITSAISCSKSETAFSTANTWDEINYQSDRHSEGRNNSFDNLLWKQLEFDAASMRVPGPVRDLPFQRYSAGEDVSGLQENVGTIGIELPMTTIGSFNKDSAIRVKVATFVQLPSITICVRQNHFTGDDQKNALLKYNTHELRKKQKAISGLDPTQFNSDYVEEYFLIDPDMTKSFLVVIKNGTRATITIEMKADRHPTRLRRTALPFKAGSPEAQASMALCVASKITVKVPLNNEDHLRVYEQFKKLLEYRYHTPSGHPDNDWWLANHTRGYKPDESRRFDGLQAAKSRIPVPDWLVKHEEPTKLVTAFTQDKTAPPLDMCPSVKAWESLHMKGLLFQRDDVAAQRDVQYAADVQYPARFWTDPIRSHMCMADVRLAPRYPLGSIHAETMLIPPEEVRVKLTLYDTGKPFDFEGTCEDYHEDGYDFRLSGRMPKRQELKDRLCLDADEQIWVAVDWELNELDVTQRMNAVTRAAEMAQTRVRLSSDEKFEHSDIPGRTCGPLLLHNVISDQKEDTYSPDLADFFSPRMSSEELTAAQELINIARAGMNKYQTTAFDATLKGVLANQLYIEGVPGSGKTYCLARIVAAIVSLKGKVMITSQSNTGTQALFDKLVDILSQDDTLAHVLDKCVRFVSPRVTRRQLVQIYREDTTEQEVGSHTMASTIHRFVKANPHHKDVIDLHSIMQGDSNGSNPTSKRSLLELIDCFQREIVGAAQVVACTTAQTERISDIEWEADVAIFDEASQVSESDVAVLLVNQPKLMLVILGGDTHQLGPVVTSQGSERNPFGNFLSFSALEWLQRRSPHLTKVTLWRNYRSHKSLVSFPSEAFYDGKMESGRTDFSAPHIGRVIQLIDNLPATARRTLRKPSAHDQRQVFFDVRSPCEKDEHTNSSTNPEGRQVILKIADNLIQKAKVPSSEIGIISMYADDARRLRVDIREDFQHLKDIEVSTVDSFQGKEKSIILLHFVAAMTSDKVGPFGFVKDSRRLNVALTRARDFMWMVGNFSTWDKWTKRHRDNFKPADAKPYEAIFKFIDYMNKHNIVVDYEKLPKRGRQV